MNNHRILWTSEQDNILKQLIEIRKISKWPQIANIMYHEFNFPKRTGKQCNERWKNILAPTILKKEWTKQQQQLLFGMYEKMGTRWCQIVKQFQGRSQNNIKNQFYSKIRKSIRKMNKIIKQEKLGKQLRIIKLNEIFCILRLVENRSNAYTQIFKKLEGQCNNIRKFILYEILQFEFSEGHIERFFNIVQNIHECFKQIKRTNYKPMTDQINQFNNLNMQNAQNEITKCSKQHQQIKNINPLIEQQQSMGYMNLSPLREQSPESAFEDNIST